MLGLQIAMVCGRPDSDLALKNTSLVFMCLLLIDGSGVYHDACACYSNTIPNYGEYHDACAVT